MPALSRQLQSNRPRSSGFARWLSLGFGLAIFLTSGGPSSAQALDDKCVVSAFNRTAPVQADGSWVLPDVPAILGPVRIRATCIRDGQSLSGQSDLVAVPVDDVVFVPEIRFEQPLPIPQRLALSAPVTTIGALGDAVQVTVAGIFTDGSQADLTAETSGTTYSVSNPAVLRLDGDGWVTAVGPGVALVSALHEGALGVLRLAVVTSGDSDGDGMPDDFEVANGFDPNNPADAFGDPDADTLTNLEEFEAGLDPHNPDTDGDTLHDGEEGGFGTNPLLFDTDGDGLSDGLEIQLGSDPLDPNDFDLAGALESIAVTPPSFHLVFNTVFSEASLQLTLSGDLIDGNTIDLTGRAGTSYTSSDLTVCSFGVDPGRVFAGADGTCTVTATQSGFSAQTTGTVSTFSPVPLARITIPGFTHNVDVAGNFAYVAAGFAGLQVVDVTDRSNPALAGSADTPGNAQDVKVANDVAYVADGPSGLRLFDVSDPFVPVPLGTADTLGDVRDVEVRGSLVYAAAGTEGLQVFDVSNPAAPQLLGSVGTLGSLGTFQGVDVDAERGLAVAAAGPAGLRVIDVTVPAGPVLLASVAFGGDARDVVLRDGFAHVADLSRSLTAVDLRDPLNPVVGVSTPRATGGLLHDVERVGDLLFGADVFFVNGVPITNVAVPETPSPTAILDFSTFGADNGTGIAADSSYVYLTTSRSLMIGQYLSLQDSAGLPPAVAVTSPAGDVTPFAGSVLEVTVEANDDMAVQRVDFLLDGDVAFTDFTRPYTASLTVPVGTDTVTLGARALDYGNNVGTTEEVVLTILPDVEGPVFGAVTPAAGTPFTSGDEMTVSAEVSDNVSVTGVSFEIGPQSFVDTTAPYSVTLGTPPVFAATDLAIRVAASDPSGNESAVDFTVPVEPRPDSTPPLARILSPGDGDGVLPGVEVTVDLEIVDDLFLDAYALSIDGEVIGSASFIGQSVFTDQVVLTPPADALPGETFTLRLQASDFGGNTSSVETTLVVVDADAVLTGPLTLDSSFNGQSLLLGSGTFTVVEPLDLAALRLLDGARLTGLAGETLRLTVAGELHVGSGSSIDVSGLGFSGGASYPGETVSGYGAGGSHLGVGGQQLDSSPPGSTYGSVYRPQEAGGSGDNGFGRSRAGGGVVRIVAESVTLAAGSAIRANGVGYSDTPDDGWIRGGAGGSVWITTGTISGDGVVEARGGVSGPYEAGSGGGGAVAIEYTTASGTVLGNLRAPGGENPVTGGAGSVYLLGPAAIHGDLIVDNGAVPGGRTRLPALGAGEAQAASGGALLATGPDPVPAYFVGHWVEVYGPDLSWKGTWRIAAVAGGELTLEDPDGGPVTVLPGDLWQGVYLFDNLTLNGDLRLDSDDPVRVGGTQEVTGRLELREVHAHDLVLRAGSVMAHPRPASASASESLTIELTGELSLEAGASIDVSGLGFSGGASYPGETVSGYGAGGSHLGVGGQQLSSSPPGSTYGSVYRPQEAGGSGDNGFGRSRAGGGVVRIVAESVTLAAGSAIRANGVGYSDTPDDGWIRGGAGGSVWITTGTISGDGVVEARGGVSGPYEAGSGGGGAVAIEYTAASGTVLGNLRAPGGENPVTGGAGTLYLKSATSPLGDLVVDNEGIVGGFTELPALGGGTAGAGSGGDFLVTDRTSDVPAYFTGHWLELSTAAGTSKGFFRVAEIDGVAVILESTDGGTVDVAEGDLWQGVYRFDSVSVVGGANLTSVDPLFPVPLLMTGDSSENLTAPSIDPAAAAPPPPLHPASLGAQASCLLFVPKGRLLGPPASRRLRGRPGTGANRGSQKWAGQALPGKDL